MCGPWLGRLRAGVLALATGATLGACSTVGPETREPLLQSLGFVQVGEASRQEIEARLGPPGASYEAGRVVSYVLTEKSGRLQLAAGEATPIFDLMLVYGSGGRLERRSLVRVR